ncbi:uncharacterized protein [Euwallacea similis]|uniref:uncharacterized protein n=1 Tax=Euwallacea similis TaxID=1736056 RepID=UPI003450015D
MTESDARKHLISDDWEDIYIKPSIDLISDEFERETNGNLLVELVRDSNDKEARYFLQVMEQLGYQTNETDVEDMEEQVTSSWIDEVLKKVKAKDCDGVIMVFSQVTYNRKVMRNIWTKFNSKECLELKNKPKIFIFVAAPLAKTRTQADHPRASMKWPAEYETPSEADMLIIQDKFDNDGVNFLSELTSNIETYGDKEDIVTLASVSLNSPPLLISTMTRKFYVKLHQYRGYHLDIRNGTDELKEKLKEMHQQWSECAATSEVDKPKRKESVLKYLKKKMSVNWKKESPPNSNKVVGSSAAEQSQSSEVGDRNEIK